MLQGYPQLPILYLTNNKSKGQGKKLMQLLHLTKTAVWKAWLN